MKYNTTYTTKVSLAQTIDFYDYVYKSLIQFLETKFQLRRVVAPAFFLNDDALNLNIDAQTRGISFDTASNYQVGRLPLSHTAFLRDLVLSHDHAHLGGYYVEASYVWRDLPETPVASVGRHEITAVINCEAPQANWPNALTTLLYDEVMRYALKANALYRVPNIFPIRAPLISAQQLAYEYGAKTPKEREIASSLARHAFILQNPCAMLVSGSWHTELPLSLYLASAFNQIVLLDRVNSYALKVASISKLATGSELLMQLGDNAELRQSRAYQKAIKTPRHLYEVKINLPRLVMALLGKGHIAEIQPDVYTEEQKVVKSRYKLETF